MGRNAWPLGIRPADLLILAVVIAIVELNVSVGGGLGAAPLNAQSYLLGAVIALPLLVVRRWPLQVLWATFAVMILYYTLDRRNISPALVMFVPVYESALAGYLAWAIGVPAAIMALGLVFAGTWGGEVPSTLITGFLPSLAIFTLAVALGEVVRSRRALAAETERRLRVAEEERRSEAARLLAEERLRIARELHDTVAHSMATITVQAGSALHLLTDDGKLKDALVAIRDTSKGALGEMRAVLGQLRGEASSAPPAGASSLELSRLPELRAAVTAAGSPVTVTVQGGSGALPAAVDHAAYRILQESLTNVLRHAPAGTPADVCLRYEPHAVTITVSNNGAAGPDGGGTEGGGTEGNGAEGNGIRGMRERAVSVGGSLAAVPGPGGGFTVTAVLPRGTS